MGQVFTFQEIERREVPYLEDFPRVVGRVKRFFATENSIVGSVVCGSVTRGDSTERSDVDCFVLYDHMREHEAFMAIQSATRLASSWHVPLVCIPCDTQLSGTHMHHIGGSFYWHLQRAVETGGLLKGDPLAQVADLRSRKEEAESYLRVKMYNLQESWGLLPTFSEERMASYLKKLLEAPVHIARKMLAHQGLLNGDSKAQIVTRYREQMDAKLSDQLTRLVALDAWYAEELAEQLENPNETRYQYMLDSIERCSGDVLRFIRSNAIHIVAMAR